MSSEWLNTIIVSRNTTTTSKMTKIQLSTFKSNQKSFWVLQPSGWIKQSDKQKSEEKKQLS